MQQPRRQSQLQRGGFTLVELLIVIVVIAILAAISVVAYNGVANNAKIATLKANLAQMSQKLETYRVDNTTYPATLAAAGLTNTPPGGAIYNYEPSSSSYCLSATQAPNSYKVTDANNTPQPGTCSGVMADGSTCPAGFIVVPGNSSFGTSDFCVMKYEAKIQGNDNGNQTYSTAFIPESRASGTPWANISQTQAQTASSTVPGCPTCHLITGAEWLTIAQNVLSVPSNWSGGAVGSGYIYSGHNDNAPPNALAADSNDANGYYGTGNSSPSNQRRTLTLTNGEVIWDLAGNVWEWTQDTIVGGAQPGFSGEVAFAWKNYNDGSLIQNGLPSTAFPAYTTPAASAWTSTQGIGQLYSDYGDTTTRGLLRGGYWWNGSYAGVFALALGSIPSNANANGGFRVAR